MSTIERRAARPLRIARRADGTAYVYPLALGFAALPFTRALTIDVGFPLKLYELIFSAAALMFVISIPAFGPWFNRKFLVPLFGFAAAAVIAYLLMIYEGPNSADNFRGGPVIDGLSRILYLVLNIVIFLMSFQAGKRHFNMLRSAWLVGCICAAGYVIYTQISFLLYGSAVMLPGIERHQLGSLGPFSITRSGVFDEGNFAGLYFLLSITLALSARRYVVALMALVALLLSLSTAAYVALIAVWGVYALVKNGRLVAIPYAAVIGVALFGIYTFFAATGKFALTNSSAAARLNEIMTALTIFWDHPWFGVGLGQYGFQYYFYEWDPSAGALATSDRHITNNIYAEILAETGLAGFVAFGWFIKNWITLLYVSRDRLLLFFATAMGIMIAWLAYPTFNIAFFWSFMGLTTGLIFSLLAQSQASAAGPMPSPAKAPEAFRSRSA